MASAFTRLPFAQQQTLMSRIVARCKGVEGEPSPVVVFDLDGTLMDNRPRTLAILQELAHELRGEAHSAAEIASPRREAEELAYLLGDSLQTLGLEHPELVERAEAFWRTRFFSDHYLKHDIAIPGSVEFARACYEAGATLVYFTGRDLPLMGLGSFQSLRDLGFPIGVVGTELVCKPDAKIPDELFKRDEGPKIARIGKRRRRLRQRAGQLQRVPRDVPRRGRRLRRHAAPSGRAAARHPRSTSSPIFA